MLSLSILLLSCSSGPLTAASPASASPSPRDLSRFVLVIEETPEGRIAHSWKPASDFDMAQFLLLTLNKKQRDRDIVLTGASRDCDAERVTCEDNCMDSNLGPDWSHIKSRGAKATECRRRCWQPYLDCSRLQEIETRKFPAIGPAVDWLKQHREQILLGTTIVIAGVVFVVVVVGTGGAILVLAPAVLLVSSEASTW